eukprot:TRINITY_DN7759_c0_g3_i2.p1 TRINITY_DN7759_c0_g3~~TRINITY_DN7759_c0_g3_i2.p1  ORF type:complete len:552 (+),score=38.04 TRINITY_DN7759_c0_g3_i2:107-1762(+)
MDSTPGIVSAASETDSVGEKSACASLADLDVTVCLTSVPSNLMRAVDIREALRGFGKHWASIDARAEDYSLSSTVSEISAFLSHDWATPRLQKTIALLFYSNGLAAWVSSLCAATCSVAALKFAGVAYADVLYETECGIAFIPRLYGLVSLLSATFTFFVVLGWWQRLRSLFVKPSTVFLDKLCINQMDSTKKATGILSLAGFLKASNRIVVLWTPRYFTRLWCTYELSSWIKLRRDFSTTVHIVPVGLTSKFVVFMILAVLVSFLYDVATVLVTSPLVQIAALAAAFFILPILFVHAMRLTFGEITEMVQLLEQFSIHQAKCFCCSNGHMDPNSGDVISCDRQLVLRTLVSWSCEDFALAPTEAMKKQASERFNVFVRRELRIVSDALVTHVSNYVCVAVATVSFGFRYVGVGAGQLLWLLSGDLPEEFTACAVWRWERFWIFDALSMILVLRLTIAFASWHPLPSNRYLKRDFGVDVLAGLLVWVPTCCAHLAHRHITNWGSPIILVVHSVSVVALLRISNCTCAVVGRTHALPSDDDDIASNCSTASI